MTAPQALPVQQAHRAPTETTVLQEQPVPPEQPATMVMMEQRE